MTTTAIKEKLFEYIRAADEAKTIAIYKLLEDQIEVEGDWYDDKEFVAELDERVGRYEAGADRAYTWDELEISINGLKKTRAAK